MADIALAAFWSGDWLLSGLVEGFFVSIPIIKRELTFLLQSPGNFLPRYVPKTNHRRRGRDAEKDLHIRVPSFPRLFRGSVRNQRFPCA
jgi:hypothetical protein